MSTAAEVKGRTALLAAAVVLGCLTVWALALVFSELAMSRPRTALQSWEAGEALGDYRQRRRLLERMGRAVAVHPSNADQRMDLGRFFAWHAARHPQGSERHRFYSTLAADRFEEAVAARPTWGFAWMLLAEQWAQLGADDLRVIAAMRRASELAPLEPGTQLKHLWLALGRWPDLPPAHRDMLVTALSQLSNSPLYFRDAALITLHHGRRDLLLANVTAPWQLRALARLQAGSGS